MEQAELAAIQARAEAELTKIPGVVAVGFGLKETGGETTRQPSLQVYVREKKAVGEIPPGERIPDAFEGIPTDVMEVPALVRLECVDMEQHSPLIGGITITNFKPDGGGTIGKGTLGFFATLDGVAGPENVVLVSNHHVLTANGASNGNTVYQPQWSTQGGNPALVIGTGPIGKINNEGRDGNIKFTYPSETELDYFVDCASAKLDSCISSWCKTNCGVSYKNEIRGLNIGGNSKVEGVARVTQADLDAPGDYEVFKVGSTTSRTKGRITGIDVPGLGGELRIIRIEVIGVDCDNIARFGAEGDSGSAIINSQNKLIGLLFAVSASDPTKAFACHIHPVMHHLKVTPISTANPPVGPAGQARADVEGFFADGINETIPLRERFLGTPLGREIYTQVLEHRIEVVGLVNHRRPVTVTWHRAQGPGFLAHAIENVRNPSHRIPGFVDGVDRETLARRMAAILGEHGSRELKQAVEAWLPFVLENIEGFDSLHELVEDLVRESVDA